jgi:hypothetical protein
MSPAAMPGIPGMSAVGAPPATLAAARFAASFALWATTHIMTAKKPRTATRIASSKETTPHNATESDRLSALDRLGIWCEV